MRLIHASGPQEQGGTCAGCAKPISTSEGRGHHVQRHADGGKTNQPNLKVLCEECHKDIHKP